MNKYWLLLAALSMACEDKVQTVDGSEEVQEVEYEDVDGPIVEHDELTGSQSVTADVLITALVSDESGVLTVALRYRQETSSEWIETSMTLTDAVSGSFRGIIPSGHIGSAKMRYYIYAVDKASNETYEPEGAHDEPFTAWSFNVTTG